MSAGTAIVGLAAALSSVLLSTVLARHARRLGTRLESLTGPLHELRGALAALELGLSVVERTPGSHRELDGCIDSLRFSLARAALGARDIDAIHQGEHVALDNQVHVDFSTLVLRSARAWSRLASSYDARLDVDWRAGPVRVHGDAGRLRQALDNLIANALEHGGGRVLVEGELEGRCVRVIISDGGRGLPGHLEEILAARSRSARGHGLSIARGVMSEHDGRLDLGVGGNGPALVLELPTEHAAGRAPERANRAIGGSIARAA